MLMKNYHDIVLWNPSIRKALILPSASFRPSRCPLGFAHYIFGYAHYILGFAPSSNDYKVLAIKDSKSMSMLFAIYSLNDHLWRTTPDWTNVWGWDSLKYVILQEYEPRRVFCGGVLYWIGHDPLLSQRTHHLLSLNFEVEQFSVMQLPEAVKESIVKFIFLLRESLAIFALWDLKGGL